MCPDRECMEKARKKRALQRNFGIAISEERLDALFGELEGYEKENR